MRLLIKSITIIMIAIATKATKTRVLFVLLSFSVFVVIGSSSSSGSSTRRDNNVADERLKFAGNIDAIAISNGNDKENFNYSNNMNSNNTNNHDNNNNIINNSNADNRGSSHSDNSSAYIIDKSTYVTVNTNNEADDDHDDDDDGGQHGKRNLRKLKRGKRYLDFVKGTRISWRTTVKNNILKVNTLWGYGFGFRSNFPFPNKEDRLRPFFKRDLLHSTIDMLDGHGLDGRACILKSYCTAELDGKSSIGGGMMFKLLKMLLSLDHRDKRHFPYLHLDNCRQILHSHCPLSFNSISPYTDDV